MNLASPCPAGQCASDDPLPPPHRGECRRSLHTLCSPLRIRRWCCPPPEHGCSAATPGSWLLALALSTTRRQPLQLLRPRQRQPTRCFSTSPPPRRRVSASLPLLRHGRARCWVPRAGASLVRSALPRCEAPEATAKEDDQAMAGYPQGSPCNFPIRSSLLQGQENQGPTPVGWSGSDCAGHIADRIQHVRCERQLRRQHMPWVTK